LLLKLLTFAQCSHFVRNIVPTVHHSHTEEVPPDLPAALPHSQIARVGCATSRSRPVRCHLKPLRRVILDFLFFLVSLVIVDFLGFLGFLVFLVIMVIMAFLVFLVFLVILIILVFLVFLVIMVFLISLFFSVLGLLCHQ
jgi:hypothetical protein